MKPIVDLRVIQSIDWVKDASSGWMRIPVGYEIQMQREGSEEWEKIEVMVYEIPNPQKDAEDGQGTA
jgi:hypothetical protein